MNYFADILSYPFRGGGKYILLLGAILSILADLASLAPVFGDIATILLFGYFCAVYFKIIESSAVGGKEAPEFPELSNLLEDIIWPMLQIAAVLLISFGPLAAYLISQGPNSERAWMIALTGFGILYAPMAVLAVVILGSLTAASPHIVIPAMIRAGWLYLSCVALLFAIYAFQGWIAYEMKDWFIIKYVILAVISMICLMANGRALGLIFRDRREELNWI